MSVIITSNGIPTLSSPPIAERNHNCVAHFRLEITSRYATFAILASIIIVFVGGYLANLRYKTYEKLHVKNKSLVDSRTATDRNGQHLMDMNKIIGDQQLPAAVHIATSMRNDGCKHSSSMADVAAGDATIPVRKVNQINEIVLSEEIIKHYMERIATNRRNSLKSKFERFVI